MLFINCSVFPNLKYIQNEEKILSTNLIRKYLFDQWRTDDYLLYQNGTKLENDQYVSNGSTLHVVFGMPGGKGGFGSMLRAIGAQIEKTTNREACRDLSGRRLRDINEEQRLKRWISKEAEREADKIRRRKDRIERLKSKPKHNFNDFEFEKERSELPDRIDDALSQGLQKSKDSSKRKRLTEPGCSTKKQRPGVKLDDFSSSSDSESTEGETSGLSQVTDHEKGKSLEAGASETQNVSADSESDESLSHCENSNSDPNNCSNNSIMENNCHRSNQSIKDGVVDTDSNTDNSQSSAKDKSIDSDSCQSNNMTNEITDSDVNQSTNTTDSVDVDQSTDRRDGIVDSCVALNISNVEKGSIKDVNSETKEQNQSCQDDLPIDLMTIEGSEQLETLGSERLKNALMSRGLKCGGTVKDRAQRLWKIRGLEPHEYPTNFLAKTKKKN